MLRDFSDRIGRGIVTLVAVAALASTFLTSCGVKGPLKPPPAPTATPGARSSDTPAPQESTAAPAPSSPLDPAPQAPSTAP